MLNVTFQNHKENIFYENFTLNPQWLYIFLVEWSQENGLIDYFFTYDIIYNFAITKMYYIDFANNTAHTNYTVL
jgi:hypothetical protein